MKISFETPFNDDGDDAKPSPKKRFLGQRKWIILISTVLFAINQGYVTANGSLAFLAFQIDGYSTAAIRTLALSGVLFALFMAFSAWAYLKRYRIQKLQEFNDLQIAEADIHSERIANLEAIKRTLDGEISSNTDRSAILKADLSNSELLIARKKDDLARLQQSWEEEVAQRPRNAFAEPEPKEQTPTRNAPAVGLSLNDLMNPARMAIMNLEAEIETSKLGKAMIETNLTAAENSITKLTSDRRTTQTELDSIQSLRSELLRNNQRQWGIFFGFAVASDIVSIAPAAIGAGYCLSIVTPWILEFASTALPPAKS